MRGSTVENALRRLLMAAATLAAALVAGCTIAPKSFFQNEDPAPLVRARSLGMGRGLSDSAVVPVLIEKLQDPDAVVRMTAHEELRLRTGQDFGYAPWAEPPELTESVDAWRNWWRDQGSGSLVATDPRPVASPIRRRSGLFSSRARRLRASAVPANTLHRSR